MPRPYTRSGVRAIIGRPQEISPCPFLDRGFLCLESTQNPGNGFQSELMIR
jgi:hypothetical protein